MISRMRLLNASAMTIRPLEGITATPRGFRKLAAEPAPSAKASLPLPADATEEDRQQIQRYLDKYFSKIEVRVYWGTAAEFAAELRERASAEGIINGA